MDEAKRKRIEARAAKFRAPVKEDDVEFVPEPEANSDEDLPVVDIGEEDENEKDEED